MDERARKLAEKMAADAWGDSYEACFAPDALLPYAIAILAAEEGLEHVGRNGGDCGCTETDDGPYQCALCHAEAALATIKGLLA